MDGWQQWAAAGRRRTAGRQRLATAAAAGSPEMAGKRSRASNRKEKTPGGRGEDVEAHQGLEGERNTAEEEIRAARRSSGGSSGVAALCTRERKEKWCGVKRRSCCPFYSTAEVKGRRCGGGGRRGRWAAAINGDELGGGGYGERKG
jgi:hypothetical protein